MSVQSLLKILHENWNEK